VRFQASAAPRLAAAVLALFAAGALVAGRAAASPSPSPTAVATPTSSPAAASSPSPAAPTSPSPAASTGTGQWVVNGATVKLGGSLAGSVDASGNTFTLSASGSRGQWNARFGVVGDGPISMKGSLTGPGPVVDATLLAFGIPVSVVGTPGTDLSVRVGLSRRSRTNTLDDSRLVDVVFAPPAAAETPQHVFNRVALDFLRNVVAFTIVGWLLLLVAPGLKGRARSAINMLPFRSLAVGAILVLDIPLAALLVVVIGLPLGLWWLGLLGLLMFLVLLVAGFAYAGFQLGRLLFDRVGWERVTHFAAVPIGVALLCLVGLIPYAGALLSVLATVYGIGSMLYAPRARVAAGLATMDRAERRAPAGRPVVE
jgi:hypothetical protein